MSRTQQDQFIDDDEEESCPLCVEDLDLSDKGFRPCPCGYQICQFCYHNVRNNMNGLCPACRRPYDDANIEFRKPSLEEEAQWKAKQAAKQKKTAVAAQKEAQKREADTLSRKHLAGLRVVQKNLVYVTGLSPKIQEDRLLETLRGEQYFGQYGKIVKIVVSKAKDVSHPQSVGVYVTYARKQDAASCIAAVDGSENGDRTLRAQFGTTKYCSAYLRNEQCGNRNCMFLHEPGEENDSFTRQDLSSMNVISTASASSSQPPPQSQQPVAAAPQSPVESSNAPALPSTASWASRAPQMSRQASRATSVAQPSPPPIVAQPKEVAKEKPKPEPTPAPQEPPVQEPVAPEPSEPAQMVQQPKTKQPHAAADLINLFKSFSNSDLKFVFSAASLSPEEMEIIKNYPPLFDENGGAKRRALRQRDDEERRRLEAEQQLALQTASAVETEDNPETSGSMQLGGDPEDLHEREGSQQHAIQPPSQSDSMSGDFPLSNDMANLNINARGLTPQQHQQLLLQQLKTPSAQQNQASLPSQMQQPGNGPGHARNVSRYTFANDTSSASAAVKPVANSKLMSQQSSMMPPGNLQQQAQAGGFYSSNVQGPPPGLKATGTPPFSGGGMFGQGHGFATSGLGYGANLTGRSPNDERMIDLLRTRNLGGQASDAGKREYMFPSFLHQHPSSTPAPAPGLLNLPYGAPPGAFQDASGAKPKKKGKKHRHANTSSSGGGVVDVADPSILQARLHQAGNTGGQGLFAGQGQDIGDPFLSTSAHPFSTDLLDEPRRATPPVPPGLEGLGQSMPSPIQDFEESRRATPTIPPGFSVPPGLSKEASSPTPSRPSSRASLRRGNSYITPAVPVLPATPLRASTPLRHETKPKVATIDELATPTRSGSAVEGKGAKSALASELKSSGSEKNQSSVPATPSNPPGKAAAVLVEQVKDGEEQKMSAETPSKPLVVEAGAHVKEEPSAPSAPTPAPLSAAQLLQQKHHAKANQEKANAEAPSSKAPEVNKLDVSQQDVNKRKHPGKLDIAAAVTQSVDTHVPSVTSTPLKMETPGKLSRAGSIAPISRPVSPTASTDSPLRKTAPRTLRVVATPTPKMETPPLIPSAAPSLPNVATKFPSRQPSIASINPPGTPSSEHISDNISVASTSFSRANSPPPFKSIVGSAPARMKTKNQQKKDRQERAKQIEEEQRLMEDTVHPTKDEPVQEAITSRKKKSRKAATPGGASSTPTTSRPASPKPRKVEEPAPPVPRIPTPEAPKPVVEKKIETPIPSPTPAPVVAPAPHPSPPSPPAITPASIISDLRSNSNLVSTALDNLFRPIAQSNTHYKASQPVTAHDLGVPRSLQKNPEIKIHPNQLYSMLSNHHGLHYGGEDDRIWSRGVITPGGAHLRHLEEALENRFIELEKELRTRPMELQYHPLPNTKLPPGGLDAEFPQFDLIAYKREVEVMEGRKRDPNAMEKAVEEGSKKGSFLVDTAGKYVNEFVMPPVPIIAPPPPAAGSAFSKPAAAAAAAAVDSGAVALEAAQLKNGGPVLSVEEAERVLVEARKVAEEREAQLRRLVKRNRKLVGMTH